MMGKTKRRLNNKGAVKSLTIFMIISVVLIGSFFSFFFSTAALNNGQIPAQYQSLINAYTSTNPLSSQIAQTQASVNTQLGTSSSSSISSLLGDIAVFGGLIISIFGFVAAIPNSILTLFTLLSYFGLVGDVISVLSTMVLAIVGVMIIFDDIISPVMKFPIK